MEMPNITLSQEILICCSIMAFAFFVAYYSIVHKNKSKKVKAVVLEDEPEGLYDKLHAQL